MLSGWTDQKSASPGVRSFVRLGPVRGGVVEMRLWLAHSGRRPGFVFGLASSICRTGRIGPRN